MTSSLLVGNLSQPRILLAMARDGLLAARDLRGRSIPGSRRRGSRRSWSAWSSRPRPRLAPLGFLADLVSIGTLFAFVIVSAAVWILRITDPDAHRPFRAPWVPFVSTMGILVNGCMMFSPGPRELAAAVRLAGPGARDLFRLQPPPFCLAQAITDRVIMDLSISQAIDSLLRLRSSHAAHRDRAALV